MSAPTVRAKWKNDHCLKILCIEGFQNKSGNTNALLEKFLSEYENASVIGYNTFEKIAKPCIGCDKCKDTDRCIYPDLDDFFELFKIADIIVFASPVYNMTFPAPLKALIDRFQPFYNGYFKYGRVQQIQKRRKAYLLVTAGGDGKDSFEFMEKQLKRAFSILNIEYVNGTLVSNTDKTTN